jgi:hypothetical protein
VGRVSDLLAKLWKEKRKTEPDFDAIGAALDQTADTVPAWLERARAKLGL